MSDISNPITNAGYNLLNLSKVRDAAIADYDRIKNSLKDEFYILADSQYFEAALYSHKHRNESVEKVTTESKKFFDSLPEPLRFGIKELGKPLVLPVDHFNPKVARCLVVKVKPQNPQNSAQNAEPVEPEYVYDVQVLDVSGGQ